MKDTYTRVFVVLNEETMQIETKLTGKPRMFRSKDKANEWASERLEMWEVIKSVFMHSFIHHAPNQF